MLSAHIPPPDSEKLVAPELMLPTQFIVPVDAPARGERHLLRALLEQAIACYRKHAFATNKRDRRLFSEAEDWLMSDEADASFSYQDVCDFLGLDASYVRQVLWREREEELHRPPVAA